VRRLSLRARLLLGVVALAAVGLVIADVATYASLRSFLLDRVDSSLEAGHPFVEHAAFESEGGFGPRGGGPGPPAQGIDWYQVRTLGGHPLRSSFLVQGSSPPKLPSQISIPVHATQRDGDRTTYFTVPARSGGGRFRVRASIEPQEPNRVLVIATSLSGVDGTLHRLLLIELLATGAVLVAIGGLGLWVVRLGLRPLREIEATSEAIAAGDLTRRVERADQQTEVGRLGGALNTMLAQIEAAFRAREASERRLRRFARRSPPSARMRSCSRAARPRDRTTWSARCRASAGRRSA
jgi:two-component system OmpR family sensor kinase